MDTRLFRHFLAFESSFIILLLSHTCLASLQLTGSMSPGFKASPMSFINDNGLFLLSDTFNFAFGFQPTTQDVTLFSLTIIHIPTSVVVWTANRGFPVRKSDNFVFDKDGKVSLDTAGGNNHVWSPDTGGKSVSAIQMLDSGNLVLIDDGDDTSVLWQSFDHPTDTILSGQEFKQGMKLSSGPNVGSLSFFLEIISGDMILYANFTTPQHYWSMAKDRRKVIKKRGGEMASSTMEANSWKFYDRSKNYMWQFIFSTDTNPNITRAAILGTNGTLSFYILGTGGTTVSSTIKIPDSQCMTPRSCDPYYMCSSNKCQCPSGLISRGCKTGITDPCKDSRYMYCLKKKKRRAPLSAQGFSSQENYWEALSVGPVRFCYRDLETATNNFSTRLGRGGFGSVFQGTLPDGALIAVKKLEGTGQGENEFQAEVRIIGSIHHVNLVKLKGFCVEGIHLLLVYEYMANGSLDKWIFNGNGHHLDWITRYSIAVSTATGLAYLHQGCEPTIVHFDIKPENILLDDRFQAKVSDFGLAKLMTPEQSRVSTALRGTRGYLAPELITNGAITEKSDVYSYGIVLLEIIVGRKNSDPMLPGPLPCYALRMMDEGKIEEIIDPNSRYDPVDDRLMTAVKVALWCTQEDMTRRPSMSKVVQMLEGVCVVPDPPTSSRTRDREDQGNVTGTSSRPSGCSGDSSLSAVLLSEQR